MQMKSINSNQTVKRAKTIRQKRLLKDMLGYEPAKSSKFNKDLVSQELSSRSPQNSVKVKLLVGNVNAWVQEVKDIEQAIYQK